MENDEMKQQSAPPPAQRPPAHRLERELEDLLGAAPRLPEERLRRVRVAVYDQLAQPAMAPPRWLRWRMVVPAAAALLLLGGALGWDLGDRIDRADADLAGPVLMAAPGGL